MSAMTSSSDRRNYFALSLTLLVLDQASKILVHLFLRDRGPLEIIPGFFNLIYSRNPGGLFGYFSQMADPWRTLLLTLLPVLAIALVFFYLVRSSEEDRLTLFGLALVLGGAVGNLIDRLFRGEVVDFLDVYASSPGLAGWLVEQFGTAHWPTFNLADSAIVCGALLLALSIVRPHRPSAPADGSPAR
jgi:signal peptidase II